MKNNFYLKLVYQKPENISVFKTEIKTITANFYEKQLL